MFKRDALDLNKLKKLLKKLRRGEYHAECDLSYADLPNANLRQANLYNGDLSYANLTDADLGGADLRRANLMGAALSGANGRVIAHGVRGQRGQATINAVAQCNGVQLEASGMLPRLFFR